MPTSREQLGQPQSSEAVVVVSGPQNAFVPSQRPCSWPVVVNQVHAGGAVGSGREVAPEGALSIEGSEQTQLHLRAPIERMKALERRWAASLLLVGTVTGFLSFALATCTGGFNSMVGDQLYDSCFPDRPCPSTRSYHAETVSEMVSKTGAPASRLFYAFSVIASICLLMSRYPWHFRNVYYAHSGSGMLPVASLRSVGPPLGMLIVALLPVVPRHERTTVALQLLCDVHTLGAALFVAGYVVLEWQALRKLPHHVLTPKERLLRLACIGCSSLFMICFLLFGALYNKGWLCCADEYKKLDEALKDNNVTVPDRYMEKVLRQTYGEWVLVDSASGKALWVKKFEFWSEVLCGFCIILSHFVIWWFSDCTVVVVPDLV